MTTCISLLSPREDPLFLKLIDKQCFKPKGFTFSSCFAVFLFKNYFFPTFDTSQIITSSAYNSFSSQITLQTLVCSCTAKERRFCPQSHSPFCKDRDTRAKEAGESDDESSLRFCCGFIILPLRWFVGFYHTRVPPPRGWGPRCMGGQ